MRVALGQMRATAGDLGANLERSLVAIAAAGEEEADLVVLPEMCTTGCTLDPATFRGLAEPADGSGPALGAWIAAAREHHVAVVGGFVEESEGRFYNSAIAIDRNGEIRGLYRKLHLFAAEQEAFERGDAGLPVFELDGVRVGMLICYDLRFPEALRLLALDGADVIVVPTAWVSGFDAPVPPEAPTIGQLDGALVQANLNQVFVVCADLVGVYQGVNGAPDTDFLGRSIAIDPYGKTIVGPASAVDEELPIAELDLAQLEHARRRAANIAPREERRTDVYSIGLVGNNGAPEPPAAAAPLSAEELLERIERDRGYVLDLHRTLAAWDTTFLEAYDALLDAAFLRQRSLDRKVKELIYIGVLTALATPEDHLLAHMRAALAHGATEREVLEVLQQVLPPAGVPRFIEGVRAFERLMAERAANGEPAASPTAL